MINTKKLLCKFLLTALAVVPIMLGADGGVAANDGSAANTAKAEPSAAPGTLNVVPAITRVNVAALLNALVTKGVLAPSEAKSIQGAAPGTGLQVLVEALSNKGVLSAADLSAIAALEPASAVAEPAPASHAAEPAPAPQSPPAAPGPTTLGPPAAAAPKVVPAVAPIRVLPIDGPANGGLVAALKMGAVKMAPYGFIKST